MPYVIRPMREKDIPDVMKIEEVSFGSHHWTKESFRAELNNTTGNYFVICDQHNKKLIGYCGFWLIMDETHVTTIAVHPDYRRKKLGEVLLQCIVQKSVEKKAKWITLEVRISNVAAQNLYYKYNFSSLGVRKKYYQDNDEDALIMWTEDIHGIDFQNLYKSLTENLKALLDKEVIYL